MSGLDNLHELQGQICYAKCCFCNTILLVSVPYSSSGMVVTISCGHCNTIFSLNLHTSSSNLQTHPNLQLCSDNKPPIASCLSLCDSSDEEVNDLDSLHFNQLNVIHKPPEKKQRAPTAYNHFIKKEIKRLKIEHPNMPHKKAFSAAAKNWAHYPQSGCRDGEGKDMIEHSIVDDELQRFITQQRNMKCDNWTVI